MHEYDIELVSFVRNNLASDAFNCNRISNKEIEGDALKQTPQDKNYSQNVAVKKETNISGSSYLIPLLASEYPVKLLAEYRSLDLEIKTLKNSIQKSTLVNSTKLIRRNKEVITDIKKRFNGLDKRNNLAINNHSSTTVEKLSQSHSALLHKLSQFGKISMLRKILHLVVELIEVPSLIESFISASMIDDALDTLEYAESTIKLLEVSISFTNNKIGTNDKYSFISIIMENIKLHISSVKTSLYLSIKSRLNFDQLSLLNTLEIIGHLRRLISLSNEVATIQRGFLEEIYIQKPIVSEIYDDQTNYMLSKVFLIARSEYIDHEYRNKSIMLSRLNCCASLKHAISLFNTPLLTAISTFISLFSTERRCVSLSKVLMNYYVNWFVFFCKKALTLVENKKFENTNSIKNSHTNNLHSLKSLATKTIYVAQFDLSNIPITCSSCQELYLQVCNVFSFSKPISVLILSLFENYMIEYYRKMLEFCIDIFSFELIEFNWQDEIQGNNLKISHIRPLSILHNEFVNILNELRQCPLKSLKHPMLDLTDEFLSSILKIIEDLRKNYSSVLTSSLENLQVINIDKLISAYKTEMAPYVVSSISSIYN
ncbi:hypothetical protein OIY81_669 [Cryptosporidium canis]|uniref:Conserved oligomeric Golgi complex subunit 8 n=1 Tax=Cryptosporidium canis TaxID=195482 RepID=A0ABQ8P7C1_9CRYT|nr:hypothetical protein OJ252_1731 [Cryptosporidium canis]KAJ1614055.1 hypothetical protein OIY81_669 [Cryptosporidium canis]